MALFADQQTDRRVAGHDFPATWFQVINPVLVLLLAPLFALLWTRINRSRSTLPDTAKIGLGMIVMGLGFVVMTMAQRRADALGIVGPEWLIGAYALQTIGGVRADTNTIGVYIYSVSMASGDLGAGGAISVILVIIMLLISGYYIRSMFQEERS